MTTGSGPRIAFFGDSFTAGAGDDDCLGWVGRLGAAARRGGCDLTIYNLGVRGDTSLDIRRRWRAEAQARALPLWGGRLVFCFGPNDCWLDEITGRTRLAPQDSLANARTILAEASAWLPTLMVGGLSTADDCGPLASLAAGFSQICSQLGVPYFDAASFSAPGSVWRVEAAAGDGAHPNRGGYQALAEGVAAWAPWRAWISAPRPPGA